MLKNYFDDDEGDKRDLKGDLLAQLGPEGYLLLLEHYAGLRLYVPKMTTSEVTQLVDDITYDHAIKLSDAFGGDYIRVPLDREFRATAYMRKGFSTRKIVRLLGLTESGYDRLLSRLKREGAEIEKPQIARQRGDKDGDGE